MITLSLSAIGYSIWNDVDDNYKLIPAVKNGFQT